MLIYFSVLNDDNYYLRFNSISSKDDSSDSDDDSVSTEPEYLTNDDSSGVEENQERQFPSVPSFYYMPFINTNTAAGIFNL